MWRRLCTKNLRPVYPSRSASTHLGSTAGPIPSSSSSSSSSFAFRHFSSVTENDCSKKRVEDVVPIGHEREELEAELQGRNILDINFPVGPFGTKEEPAVVKSYYDKRIVGCPGGEDEKGKTHECPVCSQYFKLEVVGPGGPPDGHGDDEHH